MTDFKLVLTKVSNPKCTEVYRVLFNNAPSNKKTYLLVGLGSPWYYEKFISENPNAEVYCIEDESFKFFWRAHTTTNIVFCDFRKLDSYVGALTLFNMKFDCAIMNPPYNLGGKIWDATRQHSGFTVCLMPISNYDKNNYKFVKTKERVDSALFEDAKFSYDIYVTTCDNTESTTWETYDDFLFSDLDKRFLPYYDYNRRNLNIVIKEARNASIEFFNEETDFVTVNRCCNRNTNFSSMNGIDYYWNRLGIRDFKKKPTDKKECNKDEVYWISGLAYIRFPSHLALKNFNKFVYENERSKSFINNAMWGLNMGTVSARCGWAIPQIDWEKISDHPLWKEGKYDEAVLDTMGLKWEGEKIVEIR